MRKVRINFSLLLIVLGLSFSANAQVSGASLQIGVGYIQMKDQLRSMTHRTPLRNSSYDQWEYLSNLKEAFERDISVVQSNYILIEELKNYCASDSDSYTCKDENLVVSVDSRMNSIVRDWQNAVLIIIEIEQYRYNGVPRNRVTILMNNIDRFNERAKVEYNLAAIEIVEFQEQNPFLLFTNSEG